MSSHELVIANSPLVSVYDAGYPAGPTGYMDSHAIERHEEVLVDVPAGMDVADSCGDGRKLTVESADHIDKELQRRNPGEETMRMDEGFASIFGGPVGKAVAIAMVGIANAETPEAKLKFLKDVGGVSGILGMIHATRDGRSVLHSDVGKENSSLHFSRDTKLQDSEVGCLYNGSLGKVLMLATKNETIRGRIRKDSHKAFGEHESIDKNTDRLLNALDFLADTFPKNKTDLAFGRNAYKQHIEQKDDPWLMAILEGEHPTVLRSGLLLNFNLDKVGSPNKAHALELDPYRSDLGRIALGIGPLLVERDLETVEFMQAATMLSTAVRAALVAADQDKRLHGSPTPEYLPLGIVGIEVGKAALVGAEIDERIGRRINKHAVTLTT